MARVHELASGARHPSAGLDSAAAYYVMAAVRRLAEHCRTVVRCGGGGLGGAVHGQGHGFAAA